MVAMVATLVEVTPVVVTPVVDMVAPAVVMVAPVAVTKVEFCKSYELSIQVI